MSWQEAQRHAEAATRHAKRAIIFAAISVIFACIAVALKLFSPPADAAPPFCPPGVPAYCCEEHALAYLRGGTERERESADRSYLWCMIARDVPEPEARSFHRVVRMFAGQTCAPPAKGCWRYRPVGSGAMSDHSQ